VEYLSQRGQLDVVIDGANVGYYNSNSIGAPKHVDYDQIDWMVQHFRRLKKSGMFYLLFLRLLFGWIETHIFLSIFSDHITMYHLASSCSCSTVLLVIHERHFNRALMPREIEPIYRSWMDAGILYATPTGMPDDNFFIHAALNSGLRTLLVTNDEMRDHRFQMLSPRPFMRWKERHQVRFSFGSWERIDDPQRKGELPYQRPVLLTYPDVYSRRIHRVEDGIVVPLAKRGDTNRFLDGCHDADEDEDVPDEETYLCIRPVSPRSSAKTSDATSEKDTLVQN